MDKLFLHIRCSLLKFPFMDSLLELFSHDSSGVGMPCHSSGLVLNAIEMSLPCCIPAASSNTAANATAQTKYD